MDPLPDTAAIEARLLTFIGEQLVSPGVEVDREDDLLSGDLLDSVAVLRLASYVEEEFGIGMQPSDFVVENFQNVAVLAGFVTQAGGD